MTSKTTTALLAQPQPVLSKRQQSLLASSMQTRASQSRAQVGNPGIAPHRESMVVDVSDCATRQHNTLVQATPFQSKYLTVDFTRAYHLTTLTLDRQGRFQQSDLDHIDTVVQWLTAQYGPAYAYVSKRVRGGHALYFVPLTVLQPSAAALKALRGALRARELRFMGSTL